MAALPQPVGFRRDVRLSTTSIQEMLDENVRLIHNLMAHQRSGAVKEASELQQVLHRNLIYLATIADRTAANTNPHQVAPQSVPPASHVPPVSSGGLPPSSSPGQAPLAVSGQPSEGNLTGYPPNMTNSGGHMCQPPEQYFGHFPAVSALSSQASVYSNSQVYQPTSTTPISNPGVIQAKETEAIQMSPNNPTVPQ
ncbi:SSXT domain-containing protein [Paragonimus heterotremus]|uniref:SSXT domain-containing protein n=1 Tax=Paragonimus heterotremus TaxID=100268 RepID=A0A8J4T718_9TREM|nr:SSXT domain-containing protein [Paragonimus heterotremus]